MLIESFCEGQDHADAQMSLTQRAGILAVAGAIITARMFNSQADICCPSGYIVKAMRNGWVKKWAENDWKTDNGQIVRHADAWKVVWAAMDHPCFDPESLEFRLHAID